MPAYAPEPSEFSGPSPHFCVQRVASVAWGRRPGLEACGPRQPCTCGQCAGLVAASSSPSAGRKCCFFISWERNVNLLYQLYQLYVPKIVFCNKLLTLLFFLWNKYCVVRFSNYISFGLINFLKKNYILTKCLHFEPTWFYYFQRVILTFLNVSCSSVHFYRDFQKSSQSQ